MFKSNISESNNFFIKMPSAIVRNGGISENAKFVYGIITSNRFYGVSFSHICISVSALIVTMGYENHKRNVKLIKDSIVELVELNIISLYKDMSFSEKIDVDTIKVGDMFFVEFHEEYVYSQDFINRFGDAIDHGSVSGGVHMFTSVFIDDFVRIMSLDFSTFINGKRSINRAKLFNVYIMILSRANIDMSNLGKGTKIGLDSIESISLYTNTSIPTVRKYIDILYKAKLLFKITTSKYGVNKSKNIYSRWCDRDVAIRVLDKNKSNIHYEYYHLLKIGDRELDGVEASKILKSIHDERFIDSEWVDKNILNVS